MSLRTTAVLVAVFALTCALSAWLLMASRPLPDDASKTRFCDYWTHFPEAAMPKGTDALSPEGSRAQAETMAKLGTPAGAPQLVRDGLEMRVRYLHAAGTEDLQEAEAVLASLSDEDNHAAWSSFEDYVADTCPQAVVPGLIR